MRRHFAGLVLALCGLACPSAGQQPKLGDSQAIAIDLDHILRGGINRRGELVGFHHQPSAPETLAYQGKDCEVWFVYTSDGGANDVRTARVELRDPKTHRVLLEKFSTLYPKSWTEEQVESAIREAFAEARAHNRVESSGHWEGRARDGTRIDGYLTSDGKKIATAFPVYARKSSQSERR